MPVISLLLSRRQINNLQKGKGIQLSRTQLAGKDQKASMEVELEVTDAVNRRIASAMRRSLGVRIPAGAIVMRGGAFNFGSMLGTALETGKKLVGPKLGAKLLKSGAKIALNAAGVDNSLADSLVNNTVDGLMKSDLSTKKGWKGAARRVAINTGQDALQYGLNQAQDQFAGEGYGKRPAKGSQEMRDRMAALRARRGGGSKAAAPSMVMGGKVKRAVHMIESRDPTMIGSAASLDETSGNFLHRKIARGRGFRTYGEGFQPYG